MDATLQLISDFPRIGAPIGGARRVRVPGFPYYVVYRAPPQGLRVLAVAHAKRKPGHWASELPAHL